jgi:hypothetical protein
MKKIWLVFSLMVVSLCIISFTLDTNANEVKKIENNLGVSEYAQILNDKDKRAIADFLIKNMSMRIAINADNLDKDYLQLSKYLYLFIVVCFIDSKIKPGKYKDSHGFTRLRGQFVIVVFSMVKDRYQPFIIEKEFSLERGYVHPGNGRYFLIQPHCESGPIISYEWRNKKFMKEVMDE